MDYQGDFAAQNGLAQQRPYVGAGINNPYSILDQNAARAALLCGQKDAQPSVTPIGSLRIRAFELATNASSGKPALMLIEDAEAIYQWLVNGRPSEAGPLYNGSAKPSNQEDIDRHAMAEAALAANRAAIARMNNGD